MVVELHFLPRQDLIAGNTLDVADVMMRTNEECMAWVVQKFTNRRQLTFIGMLTRTLRIEADDDEYVDVVEKIPVEKRRFALGGAAFNNAYDIAQADPHIFPK